MKQMAPVANERPEALLALDAPAERGFLVGASGKSLVPAPSHTGLLDALLIYSCLTIYDPIPSTLLSDWLFRMFVPGLGGMEMPLSISIPLGPPS